MPSSQLENGSSFSLPPSCARGNGTWCFGIFTRGPENPPRQIRRPLQPQTPNKEAILPHQEVLIDVGKRGGSYSRWRLIATLREPLSDVSSTNNSTKCRAAIYALDVSHLGIWRFDFGIYAFDPVIQSSFKTLPSRL